MPDLIHDTASAARFSDEKLCKTSLHESAHMFCDIYGLRPGQAQKVHAHTGSDKIYHVLTGTAEVILGDQTHSLTPGHTAIAPAGVDHGVRNASAEPCTLLVVMAPHPAFDG